MRKIVALIAFVLASAITVPAHAGAAAASVKFPCKATGLAKFDPIVNPDGSMSEHLHAFAGNLGVADGVHTYAEAIMQDTSCKHAGDTAAYWAPVLRYPDGTPVPYKVVAYYDRMTSQRITAFPRDFGMVWGSVRGTFSPAKRSYYGWNCDNAEPLQRDVSMVDCRGMAKNNYLTYRSFSPYCWDGVDPGVRNYGDHVFYPEGYPKVQTCPAGAVVLPRLRVNFNYRTYYCPDCYVSSDPMMGTTAGASVHTDFWNTWQQDALEALVATLNAG